MGATSKTGMYSKDVAPPYMGANRPQMITGLAPWLRQASNGPAPVAAPSGLGVSAPAGGSPWWAGQMEQDKAAGQAVYEQAMQAKLLREQEAAAKAMAAKALEEQQYWASMSRTRERHVGDGDGDDGGGDGDGDGDGE